MYRQTLRMSVLSGMLRLQEYCSNNPGADPQAAADLLKNGSAIDAGFDYTTALQAARALNFPLTTPNAPTAALLEIIATTITLYRPPWATAIPYGRSQLVRLLSPDETQCLASAQLLDPNPPDHIVAWWDNLANIFRAAAHSANTDTGREGERLSLQYERDRLAAAGRSELVPKWVSLDDNSLGYDIASFEIGTSDLPRFIEVKASSASPPSIYVTRNEWRVATEFGARFVFHVWDLRSRQMAEVPSSAMGNHIPHDTGNGQWQSTRVDFDAAFWARHSSCSIGRSEPGLSRK